MRRRTLLGGDNTEYVFSAQTSVYISYNTSYTGISITSTVNGTNVGYSVVSYDGTVVTNVTTAATSVGIYCSYNLEYDQTRSGNVVLKQNDSNKTITINVFQYERTLEIDYEGILLDGASGSYGSIDCGNVTFSDIPDWADVTYSSGKINVTASSSNSASTARFGSMTVRGGSQSKSLRIIQLPSDYHSRDYVSIGGTNWAIKNVGASSVQDYGNYYKYGYGSKTYTPDDSPYEGMEDPLASTADTATVVMGSGWRMPTRSELYALSDISETSYYWVSYNGVNGGVFNSSGNVLFFPGAGYYDNSYTLYSNNCHYWSSTPYNSTRAYGLGGGLEISSTSIFGRRMGFSVRGVQS